MRASIALLATGALFLTGCGGADQVSEECTEGGFGTITVKYGDSVISADPAELEVKRNFTFDVVLEPEADYEDKKVKVIGVGSGAGWINGQGKKSQAGKEKIVICTPSGSSGPPIGSKFKYKVTVENVGELDPHVKVIN